MDSASCTLGPVRLINAGGERQEERLSQGEHLEATWQAQSIQSTINSAVGRRFVRCTAPLKIIRRDVSRPAQRAGYGIELRVEPLVTIADSAGSTCSKNRGQVRSMPNPIQIPVFARSNRQGGFNAEQCLAGRRPVTHGRSRLPNTSGPTTSRPASQLRTISAAAPGPRSSGTSPRCRGHAVARRSGLGNRTCSDE